MRDAGAEAGDEGDPKSASPAERFEGPLRLSIVPSNCAGDVTSASSACCAPSASFDSGVGVAASSAGTRENGGQWMYRSNVGCEGYQLDDMEDCSAIRVRLHQSGRIGYTSDRADDSQETTSGITYCASIPNRIAAIHALSHGQDLAGHGACDDASPHLVVSSVAMLSSVLQIPIQDPLLRSTDI